MNSELRQDIISGDWIVIAPQRTKGKKTWQFIKKEKRTKTPIENCPFENPQKSGNKPILIHKNGKDWKIQVIENKYPAFIHRDACAQVFYHGPYSIMEGIGHHEIAITKNHHKNLPRLDKNTANLLFQVFQNRYKTLAKDSCVSYISIFHNWGPKAGASVYHPHYQIIAIPVIPPNISHSLDGSARFYQKNKKCVHCEMIDWEKKHKKRIIYENKGAIVFTPFVSREPFELRILPKKHLPYFENASNDELKFIVDAMQNALKKIENRLKDPDYNFFIHTSPIKNSKKYAHYHWHIEILPKISVSAGFELGTGIEITVIDPDEAAKILK